MNVYVRRNVVHEWWELCLETNRNVWFVIPNMEVCDQTVIENFLRQRLNLNKEDYIVLLAPPVRTLDGCSEAYYDEIGGFHDAAEGYNPNGVWCGECTKLTCLNCPCRDKEN